MNNETPLTFREVLLEIERSSPSAWLYLPDDKRWHLDSKSAVLESEEVSPELEYDPDAGIPEVAKRNNLIQILPVTVVQDVLRNVHAQKPNATIEDCLKAFEYYYHHDAFLSF